MGIRCVSCGYENDPTRVYCHNCRAKLERGEGTPQAPTGFTHPTDVDKIKRRRAPIAWGKCVSKFINWCLLAALVAVITLAVLPPRMVPPPVEPDEELAARYTSLVRDASSSGSPLAFSVPAADAQRWLATVVKFQSPDSPWKLDPRRVYSSQGHDLLRVGVEASLFKTFDLYFEGEYMPVSTGAGYTLQPVRYSVGRLPLPVALAWPVERQLFGLGDVLAVPLSQLSKASFIGVAPDAVTLRWAGTNSP